jgi:hypothetical protein
MRPHSPLIAAVHNRSTVDELPTSWHTWRRQAGNLTQENSHMSIQANLAELEKRHRALEAELAEALAHPSTDDFKIAELKRRKLLVKDEIARLQNGAVASIH